MMIHYKAFLIQNLWNDFYEDHVIPYVLSSWIDERLCARITLRYIIHSHTQPDAAYHVLRIFIKAQKHIPGT